MIMIPSLIKNCITDLLANIDIVLLLICFGMYISSIKEH